MEQIQQLARRFAAGEFAAGDLIIRLIQEDPRITPAAQVILQQYGLVYENGKLMSADGTKVVHNADPRYSINDKAIAGRLGPSTSLGAPATSTRWGDTLNSMNQMGGGPAVRRSNMDSLAKNATQAPPGSQTVYKTSESDVLRDAGITPEVVGSQIPDASGAYGNKDYSGTFFQNVDPKALDSLTPNNAEAIWRTSGGPGGGSLANSMVSQYGSNDFQSAMKLAPLMGDPNTLLSQGDKLAFTDQWMKGSTGGGGQYADPGKILNTALANIGQVQDPFMQQQMIGDALSAIEPYMDPTSYQMLMTKVSRIMDEYLTYGVSAGQPDLSGVLLDQIYNALGA